MLNKEINKILNKAKEFKQLTKIEQLQRKQELYYVFM